MNDELNESIRKFGENFKKVKREKGAISLEAHSTQDNLYSNIVSNKDNPMINNILDYLNYIDTKFNLKEFLIKNNMSPSSGHKLNRSDYAVIICKYIIQQLEQNNLKIKTLNDTFYFYNTKSYKEIKEKTLEDFIYQVSKKLNISNPLILESVGFRELLFKQFSIMQETINQITYKDKTHLNLNNGVLEITTKSIKLLKHNVDFDFTYNLNFDYKINSNCQLFKDYLNSIMDFETQAVLQDYLGYIFINNLKLEKCLLLYGRTGSNGKSVLFEILNALFGKQNITKFSLNDLAGNSQTTDYKRAKLLNKLLNYGSELDAQNFNADIFKRMISNEPITARLPYKEPFTLETLPKFIFNANKMLKVDLQHLSAVLRRLIVIPLNRKFEAHEQDPLLANKIIDNELSGVLNWILEGTKRVLANKKISTSKACNIELFKYETESNSVLAFIMELLDKENFKSDFKAYKPVRFIYGLYCDYCKECNRTPLSNNETFRNALTDSFEKLNVKIEYTNRATAGMHCYKLI